MKPSFRMLVAIAVVYVLAAISRTPSAHASTPVPTPGVTDRDVLVTLYRATDGDDWLRSDNWLTDAPIGTWYGVTTDGNEHVTKLDLSFNWLVGKIPPEVGKLTNLEELVLYGNQLFGEIPSELGNLNRLEVLHLSANKIFGEIPSTLGNLIHLRVLSLGNNRLSGMIPTELSKLTTLEVLSIRNNRLSGIISSDLGKLAGLTQLHLSGNQLSGCIPLVWKGVKENDIDELGLPFCVAPSTTLASDTARQALVALYWATGGDTWVNSNNWLTEAPIGTWHGVTTDESGHVIELDLWHNNLSGIIPPELGRLSNLERLSLSKNKLSGSIPSELGDLTNLHWLYLHNNRLSGSIPSELGNLTNLVALNLSENQLSGSIPSELAKLIGLKWLILSENRLSGSIPSELGNLTNLFWLDLQENLLIGTVPPQLDELTNLGVWYLSGNRLDGCLPAGWQNVKANDFDELGLIFCIASSPPLTAATDRDALIALYQSAEGDNWTNNDNWLSDAPIGTWHGVTTDENGRVIELYLWQNNLNGTIPSELGDLTFLSILNLFGNQLRGEIPPELGNLTSLVLLNLSQNELRGTIPIDLSKLTFLVILNLSDNLLSGEIPPALNRLTYLAGLYLSQNELQGTIPSEFGGLSNLEELHLWDNQLRGMIPSELGDLANLITLHLGTNKLIGAIPSELGNLANLKELGLYENLLSGTIPPELGNLINLSHLALSDNILTGTIPSELSNLVNLELLFLSENQLSGPVPLQLGNLTSLKRLHLWGNELTGTIPHELGDLINLTELAIGNNGLIGTIPSNLGNLSNLTVLGLNSNQLSGTAPPELGNLTNLQVLSLWGNQLSGAIPAELGHLTNLEELYLSDNLLSGTIPLELGYLNSLTHIYLSENFLTGCVPESWRNLEDSDLEELSLPLCTDRDVLVAFYQATAGANWTNSDNWLADAPIGTWYGVTTNQNGRVTELDLSENGLHGTVPPSLGSLAYLEFLTLSHNQLRGSIPPQLGNLTNLEFLHLWDNKLYGTIPPELGNLTNLIVLGLGANELSGRIPSELGNLKNLEVLHLRGNRLIGEIPLELGKLTYLALLNLSENELNGEIPPELGNLTNLEWLALFENELSGTIPSQLSNLTNLTGLELSENRLSGEIPPELGNLTNLTRLSLWHNQLAGTIPPELGNLKRVESMYLSDNLLTGCLPEVWSNIEEADFGELALPFCTSSQSPAVSETLSTAQIFATVSPAIAFVQTEIGTGSGVLIEGNYVLTNAHVVWPYHAARVVFPDGSALNQVPLKGWDLLADVALLGPINTSVQPLALLDGEDLPIGSDVYLIGYPGEVDAFPQPAIVRGILSRLRQWEPAAVTYFQIDASVAGGQSGGALVSDTGDVIGISGFKISEGQFALVASVADLLPRIRQLLAGGDPSGLGDRRLPLEGGALRHILTPESYWDAYIVNEPADSAIEVALSGADDATFRIFDPFGNELTYTETASFDFVTQSSGPHFLVFSQLPNETTTLTANRRFVRFVDPDEGRELYVGQSLAGNLDFPGDIDFFFLHLEKGEAVEVVVRSALTDPFLGMVVLMSPEEEVIIDDNSGGGLFGLDARILFQAADTGEYILMVDDFFGIASGGYVISVARPQSMDVPTAQVPMATIKTHMNVRQGPGTNYPIIDTAAPGEQYVITGKNSGLGDWWQIDFKGRIAWVYAPLVTATDAENVQVVATPDP